MQTRREFLRTTTGAVAATTAASLLAQGSLGAAEASAESDALGILLPRRVLMRDGEKSTAFGLGGWHVGVTTDPAVAQGIVERALALGVRYFDNARVYEDGRAERYYGQFLTPKYREHVFISTKTVAKDAASARRDLEASLTALKTDHLDLWLMHTVNDRPDADARLQGGVVDEFLKAKAAGKTRYIGFSGHVNPATHLYFLNRLHERGTDLDAVQMPLNLCDPHYESFQLNVLPVLNARKYGVLAMKTMAGGSMMGKLIDTTPHSIAAKGIPRVNEEAGIALADMHRYVYGLPISTLVSGCDSVDKLEANVRVLTGYQALSDEEKTRLLAATRPFAGNIVENYKRLIDAKGAAVPV